VFGSGLFSKLFATGADKTITNIGIHFQHKTNICFQELTKYQQLRKKETQRHNIIKYKHFLEAYNTFNNCRRVSFHKARKQVIPTNGIHSMVCL